MQFITSLLILKVSRAMDKVISLHSTCRVFPRALLFSCPLFQVIKLPEEAQIMLTESRSSFLFPFHLLSFNLLSSGLCLTLYCLSILKTSLCSLISTKHVSILGKQEYEWVKLLYIVNCDLSVSLFQGCSSLSSTSKQITAQIDKDFQ